MPDTEAESIIENILPYASERLVVLRQLIDTAQYANAIDPATWAVTLRPDGFRLNIARVEALTFWDERIRVLVATPKERSSLARSLRPMPYKSVPIPHSVFEGSLAEFLSAKDKLQRLHHEYILAALTNLEGEPKRTNHHKTHSAELMRYAERELAQPARYFVLLWNPLADRTPPGLMESLFSGEQTECGWTCGKRLDIAPGDHVFMRRTRKDKGVIGYGNVIGGYVDDGKPLVVARWHHFSESEFIRDDDPDFVAIENLWTAQSGGVEISEENAGRILKKMREAQRSSVIKAGSNTYREGQSSSIILTKYEASSAAREACLRHYNYKFECEICGFNFADKYGAELGAEFIHVHHINPRSHGERDTDPVLDLIPVCPNCHAMLHQNDPPLHPNELRELLRPRKQN